MTLTLPWALGLVAMLAYTAAAWPVAVKRRWPDLALAVGWLAHGAALWLDVAREYGDPIPAPKSHALSA